MSLFEQFIRLLPPTCLLCGSLSRQPLNLCQPCQKSLAILSQQAPQFDAIYALFPYEPPVIKLITGLKFQGKLSHAALFCELLAKNIKNQWYQHQPLPDLIIPVPLHRDRLKERGFNQALEIARPLSIALNVPLDRNGCERIKPTQAQSGLSANERKRNMAQAFAATKDYHGLSLAILDDVITTKSTVTALCQVLTLAGASKIDVWCCAATQDPIRSVTL